MSTCRQKRVQLNGAEIVLDFDDDNAALLDRGQTLTAAGTWRERAAHPRHASATSTVRKENAATDSPSMKIWPSEGWKQIEPLPLMSAAARDEEREKQQTEQKPAAGGRLGRAAAGCRLTGIVVVVAIRGEADAVVPGHDNTNRAGVCERATQTKEGQGKRHETRTCRRHAWHQSSCGS